MQTDDPTGTAAHADEPRAGRLVAALALLNLLGYVDRQLVAVLAPLLIAQLGLSRAQIGLLVGVAFIVVFALGTVVMGVAADRWSRPRLIAAGLAVWSAATALTGTASSFAALACWRGLVGVGEATLAPTALAMLGDSVPPRRLGLANGVYYAGIPAGFACSFALAGWLAPRLGWRACFFVLGAAGLVASALVLRLPDPPRRSTAETGARMDARAALAALRAAFATQPALGIVIVGGGLLTYASASSQHAITWLVQERGFAYAHAAWLSAVVIGAAGLAGNLAIGAVTDRARRHGPAGRLRAFVALGCLALPVSAGFYSLPPASPLFYVCWVLAQGWMLGWYGPLFAAVQEMAPAESRATVLGFGLLSVNLLGVATGPWLTGLVGDRTSLSRGLLASVAVGAVGLALVASAASRLRRR